MKITIQVTQDDIAKIPGEACDCPIYHGVRRALPHLAYVGVYSRTVALARLIHEHAQEPLLPQAGRDFIARFDTAMPVEPFSFDLDVPAEMVPAGAS